MAAFSVFPRRGDLGRGNRAGLFTLTHLLGRLLLTKGKGRNLEVAPVYKRSRSNRGDDMRILLPG